MKANLLEFRVDGHIFGIRTEYIKNIFDIETVKPVVSMPDYIPGLTKYGNTVYLLVCLEKLLGLSSKVCSNPIGKFAISVKVDDSYYSLIVDDIIKIQEVEKNGNGDEPVEFYNIEGEVIEEITPKFLKSKIKVPTLKHFQTEEISKENFQKSEEENFLVFMLDGKKFAINTDFIDRIEHIESLKDGIPTKDNNWIEKVFLIKDEVVKAGNLKRFLGWEERSYGESLIIVGKDNKSIGIFADDILDIISINKNLLEKNLDKSDIFEEYFIHDSDVVPVIGENFIKEAVEKYAVEHKEKNDDYISTKNTDKDEYLIFTILDEKFAVKMEDVEEVLDFDNLNVSPYMTDNPLVKGILALKDKSVFLISLNPIFNKNIKNQEDSSVIIINQEGVEIGLIISNIEKIESIPKENIFLLDSDKQLIKGSILTKNGEIINIINVAYVKQKTGRE